MEIRLRWKHRLVCLTDYRQAKKDGNSAEMETSLSLLNENIPYFGYGYIKDTSTLVPDVNLMFWSFRVMVGLGMYFIVLFAVLMFLTWKKTCNVDYHNWLLWLGVWSNVDYHNWLLWLGVWSIPLAYIASQAGWIVAEVGRQPWTIQDMLPVDAAISKLETGSVQTTFFIFLIMFTVLLIAEIGIMLKAIKHGPEEK